MIWSLGNKLVSGSATGTSWDEVSVSLSEAWEKLVVELQARAVAGELWDEVLVDLFTDSGKVTFSHTPRGRRHEVEPEVYVMVTMPWVEEQWYAIDEDEVGEDEFNRLAAQLCLAFAKVTLESARLEPAASALRKACHDRAIRVSGRGHDMDPLPFEIDMAALLNGSLPALRSEVD